MANIETITGNIISVQENIEEVYSKVKESNAGGYDFIVLGERTVMFNSPETGGKEIISKIMVNKNHIVQIR